MLSLAVDVPVITPLQIPFAVCNYSQPFNLASSTSISSPSHSQALEEDLINRSLLDSLEAQGDAEPIHLSPQQQPAMSHPTSKSDSSASSPEAQVTSFVIHRSDPAANVHHKQNDIFLRPPQISQHVDSNNIQTSESLFTQGGSQSLYNSASNLHLTPDYLSDSDTLPLKQSGPPKSSADLNVGPFRSSFSAFNGMNGSQGTSTPSNAFRMRQPDTLLASSQSFGPSSENYQPLGLKHQLSQQSQQGSSLPSATFESRSVDYGSNLPLSSKASQSFALDPFGQPHPVKSQLQAQAHDSFHPLSHNASATQVPYLSGVHVQSQTPYGPHLQSNGNPVGSSRVMAASSQPSSVVEPPGNQQEEISTIFVVGFPDDMQVSTC